MYQRKDNLNPGCDQCSSCCESPFCILTKDKLLELNEHKSFHFFKKGEYLFKEGEIPKGLYCIFEGSVKLSKVEKNGHEQIVRLAKQSNFIGYRALLCNDKYNATAVALEDTSACFFHLSYWKEMITKYPEMIGQLVKLLTNDLRFAENLLTNVAQRDVKGRMALALIILEEFFGVNEKTGAIKTIVRREDIANLAGTTTETAIRTVSDFSKERKIELLGKGIKLLDKAYLKKIACYDDFFINI